MRAPTHTALSVELSAHLQADDIIYAVNSYFSQNTQTGDIRLSELEYRVYDQSVIIIRMSATNGSTGSVARAGVSTTEYKLIGFLEAVIMLSGLGQAKVSSVRGSGIESEGWTQMPKLDEFCPSRFQPIK